MGPFARVMLFSCTVELYFSAREVLIVDTALVNYARFIASFYRVPAFRF
jgi:hypothetical protein